MTVPDLDLRATLRDRRRGLSYDSQRVASKGLWQQLRVWAADQRPGCAALYAAGDGEADPAVVAQSLRALGWSTAYPRVDGTAMSFGVITSEDELVTGAWGLREPAAACPDVPLHEIDVVFTPLVAFDHAGHRVGRGKGFYDRAFAEAEVEAGPGAGPRRIGLAHDFQRVDQLRPQPHDIALHAVVTPTAVFGQPSVVEHMRVRAAALDHKDVQAVFDISEPLAICLDHSDIVAVSGQ
jgi:5-formyltetrahydrofolate cyclo-ligase